MVKAPAQTRITSSQIKRMPTPSSSASSLHPLPSARAKNDINQQPRSLATGPDKAFWHPLQITMLLFPVAVLLAGLWASNAWAALPDLNVTNVTNATSPLPIVDLGYAVHQATSFNVSSPFKHGIMSLSSPPRTGVKRILHLLKHSLRGRSNGTAALCSSTRSSH